MLGPLTATNISFHAWLSTSGRGRRHIYPVNEETDDVSGQTQGAVCTEAVARPAAINPQLNHKNFTSNYQPVDISINVIFFLKTYNYYLQKLNFLRHVLKTV